MLRQITLALLFLVGMSVCFGQSNSALIIANFAYEDAPLKTPKADALLIRDSLSSIGFEVTLRENLATQREFVDAIKDFTSRTENSEIRIIYYAGHAMAVDGSNFLMPTEESFNSLEDIEDYGVDVEKIVRYFNNQNVGANILILDSCRDNPFAKTWNLTRSSGSIGGLAKIAAPAGSIIAFSTAYGDVASDGSGSNSPYAESLAKNLTIPNISIERVFALTRESVLDLTSNGQKPIEESQLLGSEILLNPTLTLDNLGLNNLNAFLKQNPSQFSDAFRQLLLKGEKDPDLSVHTVKLWVENQIEDADAPIWLTLNSLLENFSKVQLVDNDFASPASLIDEYLSTILYVLVDKYQRHEDAVSLLSTIVFTNVVLDAIKPSYHDPGISALLYVADEHLLPDTWHTEIDVDRILEKDSISPHEYLLLAAPLIQANMADWGTQDWTYAFYDEFDDTTFTMSTMLNHVDYNELPSRKIARRQIDLAKNLVNSFDRVCRTNWSPLDSLMNQYTQKWLSIDIIELTSYLLVSNVLALSGEFDDPVSILEYEPFFRKIALESINLQSSFIQNEHFIFSTSQFFYINQIRNWTRLYDLDTTAEWDQIAERFVTSLKEYESIKIRYSDKLRRQLQFNNDEFYSSSFVNTADPDKYSKFVDRWAGSVKSSKKWWTFYAANYPKYELRLFDEINRMVLHYDTLSFVYNEPQDYNFSSMSEDYDLFTDIQFKSWIDHVEAPIIDTTIFSENIYKDIVEEEQNKRIEKFFSAHLNRLLAKVKFNDYEDIGDFIANAEIPKVWSELHRIFHTSSSQELISAYIEFLLTVQTTSGYWIEFKYYSEILDKLETLQQQQWEANLLSILEGLDYVLNEMQRSMKLAECEGCKAELDLLTRQLDRIRKK